MGFSRIKETVVQIPHCRGVFWTGKWVYSLNPTLDHESDCRFGLSTAHYSKNELPRANR